MAPRVLRPRLVQGFDCAREGVLELAMEPEVLGAQVLCAFDGQCRGGETMGCQELGHATRRDEGLDPEHVVRCAATHFLEDDRGN